MSEKQLCKTPITALRIPTTIEQIKELEISVCDRCHYPDCQDRKTRNEKK